MTKRKPETSETSTLSRESSTKATQSDPQHDAIHAADTLYLNGHYKEAADAYIACIRQYGKNTPNLMARAIRSLKKLPSLTQEEQLHLNKLMHHLAQASEELFPSRIEDRVILLRANNDQDKTLQSASTPAALVCDRYFSSTSESTDSWASKVLGTVSYISFIDVPPQVGYEHFIATKKILPIYFNWGNLSTDTQYAHMFKYGLIAQALVYDIGWGDTRTHKKFFWGNADSAIIDLTYATKFSTSFLKKYLHDTQNHQSETVLDDIVRGSRVSDGVIERLLTTIIGKHLEQLLVYEDPAAPDATYLEQAVIKDKHMLVRAILESVERKANELQIEIRSMHLDALQQMLKSYRDDTTGIVQLLRFIGIHEELPETPSAAPDSESKYLEKFANDKQNVHHSELSEALIAALDRLRARYRDTDDNTILREFEIFFHSIKSNSVLEAHLASLNPSAVIEEILAGAELVFARIYNSTSFSSYYNPETSLKIHDPEHQKVLGHFTLQDACALVWQGVKDPLAMSESPLSEAAINERKLEFVLMLYETYTDGIGQDNAKSSIEKAIQQPHTITEPEVELPVTGGAASIEATEMQEKLMAESATDVMTSEKVISAVEDVGEERRTNESSVVVLKLKSQVCREGLFERIVYSLNAQHRDMMDITVADPNQKSRLTPEIIFARADSIQDALERDTPHLMLGRIYNCTEYFFKKPFTNFLPLKQYFLGRMKKVFHELAITGFFGRLFDDEEESSPTLHQFALFEQVMRNDIVLQNPFLRALNQATEIQKTYIALKVFVLTQTLPVTTALYLVNRVAEETAHTTEVLRPLSKTVLHISNKKPAKDVASAAILVPHNEVFDKYLSSLESIGELSPKETITYVASEIRNLAGKTEWYCGDIIKFHLIASENRLFPRNKILFDLVKTAVLRDNLAMLKIVISKIESLYEISLYEKGSDGGSAPSRIPHLYCNELLAGISDNNLGGGFKMLHMIGKICSTELLNLVLYYYEFRKNIDLKTDSGCTPSYIAALYERFDLVKKFLEYGADISIPDNTGVTVLHLVASTGNIENVAYLIENGANPFAADNFKCTFVHRFLAKQALLSEIQTKISVVTDIISYFSELQHIEDTTESEASGDKDISEEVASVIGQTSAEGVE